MSISTDFGDAQQWARMHFGVVGLDDMRFCGIGPSGARRRALVG